MRRKTICSILMLCGATCAVAQSPLNEPLHSPNGKVSVMLAVDAGNLTFAVKHGDETVISPSPVGLSFTQEDPIALPRSLALRHLAVQSVDARSGMDDYRPLLGKTSQVKDAYSELTLHAAETDGLHRKMDLVVRAYNAGVAFRMVLPQQPNMTTVKLAGEGTQFLFPANYACMGFNPGTVGNSHEGEFDDVDARHIRPHDLYDDPLVCQTGKGTAFALAESDVEHYPGAYLSGLGSGQLGVGIHLPGGMNGAPAVSAAMTDAGVKTPWRIVMMADRPEQLLEANLVDELAAPSRVKDTSWIQPGLSTWDWWSGPNLPGAANVGLNDTTYKAFIDLAAKMHLPYMLIDEGWAKNGKGDGYMRPDVDVTQTNPDVHMAELVAYAKERHVGLWLWLHWASIDRQMDDAMALYKRWGIRGIKVDFMDRQDQQMVDFYHRLLTNAAEHHLMVDLHGAYPPRGLARTYPNFMTQEGVMGAEYNKWSRRETASHNVRLAYTRSLLGPMDYTPGGFNNVSADAFVPKNIGPEVMTTRAQQLAMYVVYTSYFGCVSDSPIAYESADGSLLPGTEFFTHVPTTWDETRAVGGEFGKWIGVARRSGKDWYVGVMNDETVRDVALNLPFTKSGKWKVESYTDGVSPKVLTIGTATKGTLHLASGGGAVLVFHGE